MALLIAQALRDLGHKVRFVGPEAPGGVVEQAQDLGLPVTALPGERRAYMRALASWDRERAGVLWCNGLVPALATAGRRMRITHLHQAPSVPHVVAGRIATAGSLATLVPSRSMARHFPTAQVLPNWVPAVTTTPRPNRGTDRPVVIGFLGRLSTDKGVDVLARSMRLLDCAHPGRYRLLLAGEPRFVDEQDRLRIDRALEPIRHLTERAGWMEREAFFSAVDLAVFPSVVAESFGLIVAEAMSARVPFVVSDAGALTEVAGPDYPWVASHGSAGSLARAILRALATPAEHRETLSGQQYARWDRLYSPQAGRERLRHLLTDVLPQETEKETV